MLFWSEKSFTCYWSSSFSLIPLAPPLNAISFVFIRFSAQIWANIRLAPRTPPPKVWQILDSLLPPSMYFQTLCSLRLINPLIEFQPFLFIVYYFCRLSVSNAITHCFIFGCVWIEQMLLWVTKYAKIEPTDRHFHAALWRVLGVCNIITFRNEVAAR